MRILALDPGLVTGVCVSSTRLRDTQHDELSPSAVYTLVDNLLRCKQVDLVVCETYRITLGTAKLTQQPWSLELIGFVRGMCTLTNTTLSMQNPSEAKKYSTDLKLRAAGLLHPTKGGHANDAARHFFLAARKRQLIELDGSHHVSPPRG